MTDRSVREKKSIPTSVQLKITGVQNAREGSFPVTLLVGGTYYRKGDVHYIFYTEVDEDGLETKNRLTVRPGQVELRKQGQGSSVLAFEAGQKKNCHYHTIAGTMQLVSDTKRIHWEEASRTRRLHMAYTLFMGDCHMSDNELTLEMILPSTLKGPTL